MKALSIRLDDDLHSKATTKAKRELRSLNAVVGRLIEKWVAGEVDLQPPQTMEEKPAYVLKS